MRLRVFGEIALGEVLPVAAVIGERDGLLVQDLDKALGAAAMLDIGLPVGAGGGEKQAVGVGQEARQLFVDLGAPAAILLDLDKHFARSLAGLDCLDRRGERDIAGINESF